MKLRRRTWIILLVCLLLAVGVRYGLWPLALVGSAFKAKRLCSGVFVSGRRPASLARDELAQAWFVPARVESAGRRVIAGFWGLARRQAIFRPGLGCALAIGRSPAQLRAMRAPTASGRPSPREPWPRGQRPSSPPPGVNRAALQKALTLAFDEPQPDHPRRTRAVVVVYGGRLIAERYAPGFGPQMPLAGWSMTKSVTATLIGILVGQGRLRLDQPAPVPAWRRSDDPRAKITIRHLLRMESGLSWRESYLNIWGDVITMLFRSPDVDAFARRKTLEHPPATAWRYSSGTANILCGIIRRTLASDERYWAFPRRALFNPLGMHSALMETDAAGNFIGSSFMYATARDWARFGLLWLQDGVWLGRRLLPPGWVKFCTSPTPRAPQGVYGGQWWLNSGPPGKPGQRRYRDLPPDLFMAEGYEGQYLTIVPSRRLVVVRLGATPDSHKYWDQRGFLRGILAALPAGKG